MPARASHPTSLSSSLQIPPIQNQMTALEAHTHLETNYTLVSAAANASEKNPS